MSNKHKHYEMIVAKAANMGLVQFIKMDGEWEDAGLSDKFISFSEGYDYFLCLPQHKDACLHWLNGGEVEVSDDGERWEEYNLSVEHPKYPMTDFTGYEFQFRIKPKKEKRWIGFNSKTLKATHETYASGVKCEDALNGVGEIYDNHPWQFIEIEVEV